MGYGSARAGGAIRERLVERRKEKWWDRLRDQGLSQEEVDELDPYVWFVSHYGSPYDIAGLSVLILPFLAGLAYVGVGMLLSLPELVGTALDGGGGVGTTLVAVRVVGVVLVFAVVGLGLYYLHRRGRRYLVARTVKRHLSEHPGEVIESEGVLPVDREYVRSAGSTTEM